MWEIKNHTPFEAAGAFERDKNGEEVWSVAVRGSFDLANGAALALCSEQDAVRLGPEYLDAEETELRWEPDIACFLPGTDITVHGTIQPPAREVSALPLELEVGKLTHRATLHGARIASRGLLGWSVVDQQPVSATELRWGNSFGGTLEGEDGPIWSEENPIGLGIALLANRYDVPEGQTALPFIERADAEAVDNPRQARPVGYGPVARSWQPRKARAGTYDAAWEADRAPILPTDFDARFYNSAPDELVVDGHLKGGEGLAMRGFFADEDIAVRLPQVVLNGRTKFRGQTIESRFVLARVDIDLDRRCLGMCWTSSVPCNGDDAGIDVTEIRVKQMSGVAA